MGDGGGEERGQPTPQPPPISPPLALYQWLQHCGPGLCLCGEPTTPECGKTEERSCVSKSHEQARGNGDVTTESF